MVLVMVVVMVMVEVMVVEVMVIVFILCDVIGLVGYGRSMVGGHGRKRHMVELAAVFIY